MAFLTFGRRIVSAATGATVGGLVGGIPGAAAGAVGRVFLDQAGEWAERQLSKGQRDRVAEALAWAESDVKELLNQGQKLRPELMARYHKAREQAAEVIEASLSAARDSYQRKKVRHLGAFFARFAFARDLPLDDAHRLLLIAEALTFRQFCLVKVFADRTGQAPLNENDINQIGMDEPALLSELHELKSYGLLTPDVALIAQNVEITALGKRFAELLALEQLPFSEYQSFQSLFRNAPAPV